MLKSSAALKVTTLIPLKDNDGNLFDLSTWTWWNERLTSLVAGFTDLGVVTGWWRGYADQNQVFVIIVRTMKEVDVIRQLLREARIRFRQEAMYLEYHRIYFAEDRWIIMSRARAEPSGIELTREEHDFLQRARGLFRENADWLEFE